MLETEVLHLTHPLLTFLVEQRLETSGLKKTKEPKLYTVAELGSAFEVGYSADLRCLSLHAINLLAAMEAEHVLPLAGSDSSGAEAVVDDSLVMLQPPFVALRDKSESAR